MPPPPAERITFEAFIDVTLLRQLGLLEQLQQIPRVPKFGASFACQMRDLGSALAGHLGQFAAAFACQPGDFGSAFAGYVGQFAAAFACQMRDLAASFGTDLQSVTHLLGQGTVGERATRRRADRQCRRHGLGW